MREVGRHASSGRLQRGALGGVRYTALRSRRTERRVRARDRQLLGRPPGPDPPGWISILRTGRSECLLHAPPVGLGFARSAFGYVRCVAPGRSASRRTWSTSLVVLVMRRNCSAAEDEPTVCVRLSVIRMLDGWTEQDPHALAFAEEVGVGSDSDVVGVGCGSGAFRRSLEI